MFKQYAYFTSGPALKRAICIDYYAKDDDRSADRVKEGHEIVDLLLVSHLPQNATLALQHTFERAVDFGDQAMVEKLLFLGALSKTDPENKNMPKKILLTAVERENAKIVGLILKYGSHLLIAADLLEAVELAREKGSEDLVKLLESPPVPDDKRTPQGVAASSSSFFPSSTSSTVASSASQPPKDQPLSKNQDSVEDAADSDNSSRLS